MSPRRRLAFLSLALLAAGCTTPPPPYVINAPGLTVAIGGDLDVWAINMAQWAFADPGRTAGRPAEAARAAAAVDYLADALNAPRWAAMSPLTKLEMVQARVTLRQTLGIAPAAPAQQVVQSLLDCAAALIAGDSLGAEATLRTPYFTFGPERTLTILNAMPYLRDVNVATMHAGTDISGAGGMGFGRR